MSATLEMSRKVGRPSVRSPEIEDEIFSRLSLGESLVGICKDDRLPSYTTVFRWEQEDEEFRNNLARVRDEQAEYFAEQIIDLSDEAKDMTTASIARVKIYARERRAAMLKPKKYGDRPAEVSVTNINNILVVQEEKRAELIERRKALTATTSSTLENGSTTNHNVRP
jgi:hypothetical protein